MIHKRLPISNIPIQSCTSATNTFNQFYPYIFVCSICSCKAYSYSSNLFPNPQEKAHTTSLNEMFHFRTLINSHERHIEDLTLHEHIPWNVNVPYSLLRPLSSHTHHRPKHLLVSSPPHPLKWKTTTSP